MDTTPASAAGSRGVAGDDVSGPPEDVTDRAPAREARAVSEGAVRISRGADDLICPYLLAASGDWRAPVARREHRCAAFLPPASLAPEKQSRLCLTSTHTQCATYAAAERAREARVGAAIVPGRVGRWGLARTPALVEDAGGRRAVVAGIVADRRSWQVAPAIVLVVAVFALAVSGFRGQTPVSAISSPAASPTPSSAPSTLPSPTPEPSSYGTLLPTPSPTQLLTPPPSQAVATAVPSVASSPRATARTTYTVQSGDTLSAIAAKFGTTVSAIVSLNGISDPSRLKIGQVLLIP